MKTLNPLNNYATNYVELKLRDSIGNPITLVDGELPVLVCKRTLGSTTQLFRCIGSAIDSTSGHVQFSIGYTDSTHDSGPIVLEARVAGGGKDRVVGQFESYFAQSLTTPSFHNEDYSPRYGTHAMFTGLGLSDVDQALLAQYDTIFVDAEAWYYLEDEHKPKSVIMIDVWSHDKYEPEPFQLYNNIVNTPSEMGAPEIQNADGRYLYEMGSAWMYSILGSLVAFCQNNDNHLKGVCLLNYYPDMGTQWFLENGDDLLVWADRTDGDGDLVPNFFESTLQYFEGLFSEIIDYYLTDGIFIVGGTVRELSTTKRLSLNLGSSGPTGHEELLERLEDSGANYPDHYAQTGDFLQVNPYDSTGAFGQWVDNDYGSGGINFARASFLAANSGCSLGAAYGEAPLTGKPVYSLIVDPRTPRWYHY